MLARTNPDRAGLTIGELFHAPGVPAVLDSGGFNRHTFMCGQSGSGKTYSLGLLLEQVLAETELRVIILDPNSDYVGLGRMRADADPQVSERYRGVPEQVAVWGNDERAQHRLQLRFAELDTEAQAAILGLDPSGTVRSTPSSPTSSAQTQPGEQARRGLDALTESDTPGARELGLRAANLGVLDWDIWAGDNPSILQELDSPSARCTVVDLGSLATRRGAAAGRAGHPLEAVERCGRPGNPAWSCSTRPTTSARPTRGTRSGVLSTSRTVQIAAEGRKFGLYLLVSTQRPHKVHEGVVSQCDNALLMRMNSHADIAGPDQPLLLRPGGTGGRAVVVPHGAGAGGGKIFPLSGYVRMGARVSEEGGADIPTDWARPRSY